MMRNLMFLLGATLFFFTTSNGMREELFNPTHSPIQIVEEILVQLKKDSDIEVSNYYVESVKFDYVSAYWSVLFYSSRLEIGNHFVVKISDSNITEIEIVGGI